MDEPGREEEAHSTRKTCLFPFRSMNHHPSFRLATGAAPPASPRDSKHHSLKRVDEGLTLGWQLNGLIPSLGPLSISPSEGSDITDHQNN